MKQAPAAGGVHCGPLQDLLRPLLVTSNNRAGRGHWTGLDRLDGIGWDCIRLGARVNLPGGDAAWVVVVLSTPYLPKVVLA